MYEVKMLVMGTMVSIYAVTESLNKLASLLEEKEIKEAAIISINLLAPYHLVLKTTI